MGSIGHKYIANFLTAQLPAQAQTEQLFSQHSNPSDSVVYHLMLQGLPQCLPVVIRPWKIVTKNSLVWTSISISDIKLNHSPDDKEVVSVEIHRQVIFLSLDLKGPWILQQVFGMSYLITRTFRNKLQVEKDEN